MSHYTVLLALTLSCAIGSSVGAQTPTLLHDNGSFTTGVGSGAGGADLSVLQSSLSMTTYGFTVAQSGNWRIADDFEVPSGASWNISQLRFFAYQTGSTTSSSFTELRFRIWNGLPDELGSSVVYGDLDTNVLALTEWTNVYRVLDTDLESTSRPIMSLDAMPLGGIALGEGHYWVEFTMGGTLGSGPFMPPVTSLGVTESGDALQNSTTTWNALIDSGAAAAQGAPFRLYGSSSQTRVYRSLWKFAIKTSRDTGFDSFRDQVETEFTLGVGGEFQCAEIEEGNWWLDKSDRLQASLDVVDLQRLVDNFYGEGTFPIGGVVSQTVKIKRKLGKNGKPGRINFSLKARVEVGKGSFLDLKGKFVGSELVKR